MELTLEDIIQIREEIEGNHKINYKGIQKKGVLELILSSTNYRPYGYDPHPNIYSKCGYLFESLCKEHTFYDGNKRTSLLAAAVYMRKNGYYLVIPLNAVRYTILIAQEKKNLYQITNWVRSHSAKSKKSYQNKVNKYIQEPTRKVIWMLENDREKQAYDKLSIWLAFDIYPEHNMNRKRMLKFLYNLIDSDY